MRARVLRDPSAVAEAAAREFIEAAASSVRERGRFLVALAGGQTPLAMYQRLASPEMKEQVAWPRVEWFWGDERAVAPDDPASNYGAAHRTLLEPLGIDGRQVHRMRGEADDLEAAAREYEAELTRIAGDPPELDLVLLGMGVDGHVASLFPQTAALKERMRYVVVNHVPSLGADRLTLTFPVLVAARHILIQVTGSEKGRALHRVLKDKPSDTALPAQRLREAAERVTWLMDAGAAQSVQRGTGH